MEDEFDIHDEFAANVLLDMKRATQEKTAKDHVKVMADHFFGVLAPACPHLVALVVEATWEDGDELECGGFIRTKQTDVFGNISYVGVAVKEEAVKEYVPCSEVLEPITEEPFLDL
jgi:hypothetical protein